ncbi:hypothetical protein [Microbacterium sp. RURRCA19A]|uniref:hypothetical protein n=1 Tax=Microbacterium sp. RURRCA19A TaxID=1907391 RepID=UPI000954722D|nr:hypothetical protein [Microbacterium sp. RURRCA19A]SIS19725.1 hypothetical protein SAMN05880568_3475 [Microbacterium sp. RURRCA19A]
MADAPEITFHTTDAEVRAAWRSLCQNGGYSLYVDSDGALHALRLGVPGDV